MIRYVGVEDVGVAVSVVFVVVEFISPIHSEICNSEVDAFCNMKSEHSSHLIRGIPVTSNSK